MNASRLIEKSRKRIDEEDDNAFLIGFRPVNIDIINNIKPEGFEYNFIDDPNDEDRICQIQITQDLKHIRFDIYGVQKDNHPKDVILTEDEMIEFIQKLIDEHITIYDVFSKRFKY